MGETMKSLDRMTKAELIAQVQSATQERDALLVKVNSSDASNILTPSDVVGMSVADVITRCLEQKVFANWNAAALVVTGSPHFPPSMIPMITAAFDAVLPGASAVIVSKDGTHRDNDKTAGHPAWLQEHGFTKLPPRKTKKKAQGNAGGKIAGKVVCINGKYYQQVG